jgi:hypothetical protein
MKETFDWHSDLIERSTKINGSFRLTQNVRRYFEMELGYPPAFDRSFMTWLKASEGITILAAVKEYQKRLKEQ